MTDTCKSITANRSEARAIGSGVENMHGVVSPANKPTILLGCDPGLASMGYALVKLHAHTEEVLTMGVFRTQKSDRKRGVLVSDDNLRRAREIAGGLAVLLPPVSVICVESMSFPRNSSAAAKMAMTWGILAALGLKIPIVQASPQEIKKAVAGNKKASKQDVQEALTKRYGAALEPWRTSIPATQREHAFDALAAIVTALDSEVLLMARSHAQAA